MAVRSLIKQLDHDKTLILQSPNESQLKNFRNKFLLCSREKQPNVISSHNIFPNQILTNFKIIINKKKKEKKRKKSVICLMSATLANPIINVFLSQPDDHGWAYTPRLGF